jgi:putative ABC transport system permease protein
MVYVVGTIVGILVAAGIALVPFLLLLFSGELVLTRFAPGRGTKFVLLALRSLRRNLLRTSLTYLAVFVLVFVVTLVWSMLYYLDALAVEKTKDLKVIVNDKWQIDSRLPWSYARPLSEGAANPARPHDVRPQDAMTWQVYMGTVDAAKQTREGLVVLIALEPRKLLTMMDAIWEDLIPDRAGADRHRKAELTRQLEAAVALMEANKRAVVMGQTQLLALNKRVGERFTLTSQTHTGIDLEFEIVGAFPPGRYNELAVMNRDYLNDALDQYPKTHGGIKHPMADRSLTLVWLQLADREAFNRVAEQIESSGLFRNPAVKCETLSSGIAVTLDVYGDLIWGIRWLLAPSILGTMALVLANAISINVRERRTELAVLKVLGFRPGQILALVLGEALLIGAASGLLSAGLTYGVVNEGLSGVTPWLLHIPASALWWGPAVGALTALAGSLAPAWSAGSVKVSEVFARVA